ncbi:hypothetical protein NA56DRAFT_189097 [Hyaloscypha hepaticicola]|uniref:Uncharacterized protein n=1 Tax=Hyaloscypha hepaticicola TaxID=2082293 RepID=A0A2J6Q0M4_9HELO|nr:hypothetical protein NA56DRAFT_189097 [Hyaloscypha hepaticicola]
MASSVGDFKLASTAAGFTLGFGVLCVWNAIQQTRAVRSPLRSVYIFMVWGEIIANLSIGIIAWLFLDGTLSPSIGLFFGILFLWVFEVQLLMQIIINRITVVVDDHKLIWKLKWGTALIITMVNIAVFIIWIPAHLVPPPIPIFVQINKYWDRTSKVIILIVDAGLNYFFLHIVKKRLVNYHGLTKYAPLVSFNAKLMVLSVSMDLMLICLMSLKNQVVYIQFHPVAYMVKLNIEMSMASLITKIARHSVEARNNEFMVQNSSSHNHSHFHTHTSQVNASIGLKPGVNVSAVAKMRGGEEREEFEGIRTLKEVDVVVESMANPGDGRWRKSESDSTEDGFGRKPVSKMGSDDELPLAPPDAHKRVSWKN